MSDGFYPENPDPTRKSVSIPLVAGWPGYALTAAIVAIRAFQPGAEPMSQWSFLSWVLMTIPALFPLYAWAALGSLWLLARGAVALLEKAVSRRKR